MNKLRNQLQKVLIALITLIPAQVFSQNQSLTMQAKNITLLEVLTEIRTQTGYDYILNDDVISPDTKVSINVKDVNINYALELLFRNLKATYAIKHQTIIVTPINTNNESNNIIIVSGIVIDSLSYETISFAAIQIEETKIGTITNEDGKFELKISKNLLKNQLLISCLGYETDICKIKQNLIVKLAPRSFNLAEIVVKPLNPIEVLKQSIEKIPENYATTPVILKAFYRSLFKEDTTYINLVEAVCDLYYSPYNEKFNVFDAQKDYYKNVSNRNCSWTEGVNNYFDLYTNPKDQLKIVESRLSEYNSNHFNELFVIGSPLNMAAVDKVKFLNDFMDESHFKHYKYKIDGRTTYDGQEVIVISFKPKTIQFRNNNPGYAKYVNRKKYYNAEFEGKIYINLATKAFIRFDYKLIKVKPFQQMKPYARSIRIDYKEINGKWYLSQIFRQRSENSYFKEYDDSISVEEQLIVNRILTKKIEEFEPEETVPHSNYFTLNRYPMSYNKKFWNKYNLLTHNKLSIKATYDLQQKKSLEQQFVDMQKRNDLMPAPKANQIDSVYFMHGEKIIDKFKWLEKKESAKVIQYLKDENRYTHNYFVPLRKLQNQLVNEMIERNPKRNFNNIYNIAKNNEYIYYERYGEFDEYPQICRKKETPESLEQVVFDIRQLADKYEYFEISETNISPDNKYLAISIDTIGNERYKCLIFDIDSKQIIKDKIKDFWGLVWTKNSKSFYYVRQDSSNRQSAVYKHNIGESTAKDKLVYFEEDVSCDIDIHQSQLKNFAFITIGNYNQSELRYINLKDENEELRVFYPREFNHIYIVKESENEFYILSNKSAINNKLFKTSKENTNLQSWEEIIKTKKDTLLKNFRVCKDYLILEEIYNVQSNINVLNKKTKQINTISFNEKLCSVFLNKSDYHSDTIGITITTPNYPAKYYKYSLSSKTKFLEKEISIKNYEPQKFVVERIWAKSIDGVKVPISLIYSKKAKLNRENPLILEAYGSYGRNTFPRFSIEKISLLDRGFIYAIAHVRGSSVLGNKWYDQGRLSNKKNTFNDYITCAEHLINKQYTDSSLLFGIGGSAGGMLMGVVANTKPKLFRGIILEYPAVCSIDWLNDTLNSNFLEFGDVIHNKTDFDYIKSYSPYENIKEQNYPAMLFVSGYNDLRVKYWNATKMIARLRVNNIGKSPILLRTYNSGHSGGSGIYEYYRSLAYEYSFILSLIED